MSWFSSAGLKSLSQLGGMMCERPRRNAATMGAIARFSL